MEVVVYKYYVNISVAVIAFYLWKLIIPSWDGVSGQFVQPIAEQLMILLIVNITFTTQTFDYIIFKRKVNSYELCLTKSTLINATV